MSRAQRLLEDLPECAAHGYPLYLGTAGLTGVRPRGGGRQPLVGCRSSAGATTTRRSSRSASTSRVGSGSSRRGWPRGWRCSTRRCSPRCRTSSTPLWTGAIYCGLMDACNELRDLRRASEWTEATRRWSDPLPLASLYPGICRVHRAQVLQQPRRLGRGRAGGARRVRGHGRDRRVRGRRRLLRGRRGTPAPRRPGRRRAGLHTRPTSTAATRSPGSRCSASPRAAFADAAASIAAAIAGVGGSRLERAPLLAAQSEIALATGDLDLAEAVGRRGRRDRGDLRQRRAPGRGTPLCSGRSCSPNGRVMEALGALRMAFNEWTRARRAVRGRPHPAAARPDLRRPAATPTPPTARRRPRGRASTGSACCPARRGRGARRADRPRGRGDQAARVRQEQPGDRRALFLSPKTVARHLSNIFAKIGSDLPVRRDGVRLRPRPDGSNDPS